MNYVSLTWKHVTIVGATLLTILGALIAFLEIREPVTSALSAVIETELPAAGLMRVAAVDSKATFAIQMGALAAEALLKTDIDRAEKRLANAQVEARQHPNSPDAQEAVNRAQQDVMEARKGVADLKDQTAKALAATGK